MIPNEYQQVLFIESTGKQWIDTELVSDKPDAGYQIILRTESSRMWGQYFAGPKVPSKLQNPPKIFQWSNGGNAGRLAFEGFKPNQANIQIPDTNGKISNIIYNEESLKFNNKIIGENGFNTSWGNVSYYVFNGHEEHQLPSSMALYALKMWSGNEIQRDFVPCFIKDTGEIGLYDLIGKKFYHNLGTTPFIKGPDIQPTVQRIPIQHFRRRIILANY